MTQRILLPLDLDDPTPLPGSLIRSFAGTEIVLLGWFRDDSPSEGSDRDLRTRAHLHEQAAALLRAGADVTVDVTYGSSVEDVRTTIANRTGVDAVYVPGPITTFGRLLVALRDERTAMEAVDLLEGMTLEGVIHVTVFHVAADEADREAATEQFETIAEEIRSIGVPPSSVDVQVVVGDDPAFEIATRASDYDAVMMGETGRPSIEEGIFGPVYQQVQERAEEPVILVNRP